MISRTATLQMQSAREEQDQQNDQNQPADSDASARPPSAIPVISTTDAEQKQQ
ncbi:MAG: hypothetical protein HYX72_15230 [Acidobacteria bacterium]|nr:hypothetical protein [Acidobacteriota bacterium]